MERAGVVSFAEKQGPSDAAYVNAGIYMTLTADAVRDTRRAPRFRWSGAFFLSGCARASTSGDSSTRASASILAPRSVIGAAQDILAAAE